MKGTVLPAPRLPSRAGTRLLLGVLLLPILVSYAIMARFSLNVPLIDDYPTVLGFAVQYERIPTLAARLHYILADQYTEYKLVFIHVFTALQLALVHHVSFTFTFWVGQVALLGLLLLFWKSYFTQERNLHRRLLLFAPMVLLLFSLNYAEALDWVACSIGYICTIALALAALYLLADPAVESRRWAFPLAIVCALAACTIAANAFLLLPLGLIPLLAPKLVDRAHESANGLGASRGAGPAGGRAYGRACLWFGCFGLALVPYVIHYTVEMHSGSGPRTLIPLFFLSFLGSASPLGKGAMPLGLLILTIYGAALRSRFYRTNPAAMLGFTWLLGSAALAAIGRGRTGLAFSTVSRYKLYSDMFLMFSYGYLAQRIAAASLSDRVKRNVLAAALIFGTLFYMRSDVLGFRILRGRDRTVRTAFARYYQDPQHNSPLYFGDPKADAVFAVIAAKALSDTNAAVAAGFYQPPR